MKNTSSGAAIVGLVIGLLAIVGAVAIVITIANHIGVC